MSRRLQGKVYVDARLRVEEPLHVGALADDLECDMPLQRDGCGRIVIPGTSLAGALRAWTERRFPALHNLLDGFWGHQPDDTDEGAASFCLVNDALIEDGAALEELVHRVRLDAHTAAAREGGKFDQAVLARGQRLSFSLELEVPEDTALAAQYRALLGWIMRDLQDGLVRLGGGKQHGLGAVRAEQIEIWEHAFTLAGFRARAQARLQHSPAPIAFAVAKKLDNSGQDGAGNVAGADCPPPVSKTALDTLQKDRLQPQAVEELSLLVQWHPVGALMSKAPFDGNAIDILPLVAHANKTHVALALPGTGIRGALRHTLARIVRTVLDRDEAPAGSAGEDEAPLPGIDALFGRAVDRKYAATRRKGQNKGSQTSDPAREGRTGALRTPGLLAENARFSVEQWDKIAAAKGQDKVNTQDPRESKPPQSIAEAINHALDDALAAKAGGPTKEAAAPLQLRPEFRRSQDRWTAITANLFQELQPLNVRWPALRFTLELDRLPPEERDIGVALLLLAVSEMRAGRFTLGFGANQSFGTVAVDAVTWESRDGSNWDWLNQLSIGEGAITVKDEACGAADAQKRLDQLRACFAKWAEQQPKGHLDKEHQEGALR